MPSVVPLAVLPSAKQNVTVWPGLPTTWPAVITRPSLLTMTPLPWLLPMRMPTVAGMTLATTFLTRSSMPRSSAMSLGGATCSAAGGCGWLAPQPTAGPARGPRPAGWQGTGCGENGEAVELDAWWGLSAGDEVGRLISRVSIMYRQWPACKYFLARSRASCLVRNVVDQRDRFRPVTSPTC